MLEELDPDYVGVTPEYRSTYIGLIESLLNRNNLLDIMNKLRRIFKFDMLTRYDSVEFHLSKVPMDVLKKESTSNDRYEHIKNCSRSIEDDCVEVEDWDGFIEQVTSRLNKMPLKLPVSKSVMQNYKRREDAIVDLEAEVFLHIKNAVLDMAEEAMCHSLSRYRVNGTTPYNDMMISRFFRTGDHLRPDVFVRYVACKNVLLCGEFKFVACDISMDLNAFNGANGSSVLAMRKEKCRSFEQLYGYMSMNHSKYGFLTNGNVLRCVKGRKLCF